MRKTQSPNIFHVITIKEHFNKELPYTNDMDYATRSKWRMTNKLFKNVKVFSKSKNMLKSAEINKDRD